MLSTSRVLKYYLNNYYTFWLYILSLISTICIFAWLTFLVGVNTALEYENIDYVGNTNDILIVYSLLHASTCYAYILAIFSDRLGVHVPIYIMCINY